MLTTRWHQLHNDGTLLIVTTLCLCYETSSVASHVVTEIIHTNDTTGKTVNTPHTYHIILKINRKRTTATNIPNKPDLSTSI